MLRMRHEACELSSLMCYSYGMCQTIIIWMDNKVLYNGLNKL